METPDVDRTPPVRRIVAIDVDEIEGLVAGHVARLRATRVRDVEHRAQNSNGQQQRENLFLGTSISL